MKLVYHIVGLCLAIASIALVAVPEVSALPTEASNDDASPDAFSGLQKRCLLKKLKLGGCGGAAAGGEASAEGGASAGGGAGASKKGGASMGGGASASGGGSMSISAGGSAGGEMSAGGSAGAEMSAGGSAGGAACGGAGLGGAISGIVSAALGKAGGGCCM